MDFQFDLPEIKLPSLHEVRRLSQPDFSGPPPIAHQQNELLRFEVGRTSVVEGKAIKSRDVNVLMDGVRMRGVQAVVAGPEELLIRKAVSEWTEGMSMMLDGLKHDFKIVANDPWTGDPVHVWEFHDVAPQSANTFGKGSKKLVMTFNSTYRSRWEYAPAAEFTNYDLI